MISMPKAGLTRRPKKESFRLQLKYLLDTNICIYIAKNKPAKVAQKFAKLNLGEVGMSLITYGELLYGAVKSEQQQHSKTIIENLIRLIIPLPLPVEIGHYYALIRMQLEKQGTIIGNNDLWIAAHCMALNVTLVTNNTKEFARIKNLKLENWV
jgi:tRNA(fMet)-specific endonuclease VapC